MPKRKRGSGLSRTTNDARHMKENRQENDVGEIRESRLSDSSTAARSEEQSAVPRMSVSTSQAATTSGGPTGRQRNTSRERVAAFRSRLTPEEQEQARVLNREQQTARRSRLTPEEQERARIQSRMHALDIRAAETPEQRELRLQQDRAAHVNLYVARQEALAVMQVAAKSTQILTGQLIVSDLSESNDSIREMNVICKDCGARKFKRETSRVCCLGGKVILPHFPLPPDPINNLWNGDTEDARLFRKYSRSINNAVCLASLKVSEPTFTGPYPFVTFQGKVAHKMGPLRPEPNKAPVFAQLYLMDSEMESIQRFNNMYLPKEVARSAQKKGIMKDLLQIVQRQVHDHNPFVQEFKQVLEIPEGELGEGKVIISAKAKPQEGHSRVYNAPVNLQELSVVTTDDPHDFVVQLRSGGPPREISYMNSTAMPLHFAIPLRNSWVV